MYAYQHMCMHAHMTCVHAYTYNVMCVLCVHAYSHVYAFFNVSAYDNG